MTAPKAEKAQVCGPGCFLYICPSSCETECGHHGGFDVCCDHPRCPGNMRTPPRQPRGGDR